MRLHVECPGYSLSLLALLLALLVYLSLRLVFLSNLFPQVGFLLKPFSRVVFPIRFLNFWLDNSQSLLVAFL